MPKNYYEPQSAAEKAYLIGAEIRGDEGLLDIQDSLNELALLAHTAGLEVVGQTIQRLHQIDPATFIGSGKVDEVLQDVEQNEAQVVIFDDELSPRHQRELEKRFGDKVRLLDRSALILDIFAQHARTHEGALQVELAQYEYRLPRLTRQWTHLARQAGGGGARGGSGGVGLRGPGETQLEVDRREISTKISKLKADLEKVRTHRETHRQKRKQSGIPVVSLVGYTNAGKSTLLKAITGADTYIADQLFATLDPLTRQSQLPSGRKILLSDTVGFIQKLPTTLVAAFRATLEEITQSNLLLHVVDVSHPNVQAHIEAVEDTLAEIDMPNVRRILVWNKADLWHEDVLPSVEANTIYDAQVLVSAAKNIGIEQLLQEIEALLKASLYRITVKIPYTEGEIVSLLYNQGIVESRENQADGVYLGIQVSSALYEIVSKYQVVT